MFRNISNWMDLTYFIISGTQWLVWCYKRVQYRFVWSLLDKTMGIDSFQMFSWIANTFLPYLHGHCEPWGWFSSIHVWWIVWCSLFISWNQSESNMVLWNSLVSEISITKWLTKLSDFIHTSSEESTFNYFTDVFVLYAINDPMLSFFFLGAHVWSVWDFQYDFLSIRLRVGLQVGFFSFSLVR